jgi:hypothetical protein
MGRKLNTYGMNYGYRNPGLHHLTILLAMVMMRTIRMIMQQAGAIRSTAFCHHKESLYNPEGIKIAFAQVKEMIFPFIPSSTECNFIIRMVLQLNSDRWIDALMIETMWDAFMSDSVNGRMLKPYAIESIEDSWKNG